MATSFAFYHDSALTQIIDGASPLTATHDTANLLPPVDTVIYLGSTNAANKAQADSNPGVDPIVVSVVDADPATGSPATEFKLALTSGGLDTAVAGDPLTLSTVINGGAANAVPIYTRRTSAIGVAGSYTDLSLQTNTLLETPI